MIFHLTHNDLDGIACGILVKTAFPRVTTCYVGYDDIESHLENLDESYSTVIITDVTPKLSTMDKLAGEREVIFIDHHASSENIKEYPFEVVHDITKCAAMLTFEYLKGKGKSVGKYSNFIDCVNDFDMWHLQRADSLQMNILLNQIGLERFEKRFFTEPYDKFNSTEAFIINLEEYRRDSYIERAAKNASVYTDKEGHRVAVVFAELYGSELGNHLIANGTAEYVVMINAQRKKVSLRSCKEYDVCKIAVANGGGGHKNAAGFNLKYDFNLFGMLQNFGINI